MYVNNLQSGDRHLVRLLAILLVILGCAAKPATGQPGDWFHSYRVYSNLLDNREVQARRIVFDDQGFLWCSTPAGLYRYDGYEYLSAAELISDSLQTYFATITALATYSPGKMILGTASGHVVLLSTTEGLLQLWDIFSRLGHSGESYYITQSVRSLFVDDEGMIWVGSSLGLRRCVPGVDSVEYFRPFPEPEGIYFWAEDPNIIWSILPDPIDEGRLILAAQGGVVLFDKRTGQFVDYYLQGKPVNAAFRDNLSGLIYATVWEEALYEIDLTEQTVQNYPLDFEMYGIWTLFRSPRGNKPLIGLMGEPNLGFFEFDVTDKTYSWSTDPDKNPILNAELAPSSWSYFDPDSNLWAHSYDTRVEVFLHPPETTRKPNIHLTTVSTPSGFRTYFPTDRQITLPAGENNCQVKFAAVKAFNPDSVMYAFKIRDRDSWTENGSSRQVTLNNLGHGAHKLLVRASDPGTFGTVEEQVATIHVSLPIWQRTWAQLTGLMLLMLGLLGVNTLRLRQARSRKHLDAMEKKFAELELTALRAQMNPHFMFNSLNSIKNFILRSERREAAEYLSNFAHLIRMILQYSRERYITLKDELEALMLYVDLEKLRFEDDFEFSCVIDDNVDINTVEIPPLILQPFVENAIWHGLMHKEEPGNLVIDISKQNGSVIITIDDDGVGREKAAEYKSKSATRYKSMGLGMTRDRIEIHNKLNALGIGVSIVDKKDDLGEAAGTKVIVRIPTQNGE